MRKLKLFALFAAMLLATSMWAATVDLATVTGDRTFQNGDVLQGTLSTNAKLSIAAGATVTLNGVNINWAGSLAGGDFAGLNCLGNATIILADGSVNYVKGFMDGPSGIHVAPNYTVTIQGNGTLHAATKGGGAAIGSGYSDQNGSRNAGNIVINGGTIYANGGNLGAGIGGGGRAKVGNITINGGIIFAVGGGTGAGIGGGQSKSSSWKSEVGNVTISSSVRYLIATKGSGAAHSIGKGSSSYSTIGTIKVGNNTGAISTSPYVYCPPADNTKSLINAIGTVAHTEACKAKIDAARAAYNSLEIQEMRDLVTNYSTLTAAEAAYNTLVANAVIDKINAIGSPITAADQTAIEDARAAYNALTDTQKGYVTNYSELTDAEAVLAVVNLINAIDDPVTASSQTAIDAARNAYDALTGDQQALVGNYATLTDAEAALAVVNLINAIGSPITAASQSAIDAARNAYDALTNAQKSYVDNYSTLTDAEAAYAALTPSADPTIYTGFTATAGSGGFGGEDHTKLVDGKFAPGNEGVDWTKWCADSQHKSVPSGESESCWWVDFNAANPIAVTGYILTTGNDNIPHGAGRNPSSWIIKAKLNESDSWTTIATVSNDNTMQIVNFTDFAFTLDQAGTYKYFRFMVSAPVSGTCMQLCELRFTGSGSSEPADPEALKLELLQELWTALGEDIWTGYGVNTGVISYSRGGNEAFHASFMGGNYAFDLPFAAFTNAEKAANTDGSYTYTLTCNLPAQTGMGQETLHVTVKNGEIEGLHSDNAGIDMTKEEEVTGWAALQTKLNAGGMVKLGADVTAAANEEALEVPANVTVVLDLNGHSIDRALASAVSDGSVLVNDGTLAIMGQGAIVGGNTTGNGGGILNNGILTLYGGEIKANHAANGGGVYNNGEFWMTGGLIKENAAESYKAIGGEVIFNAQAMVQIDAQGTKVSVATALANMADYNYVQPVMPSYDDLQPADPEALKLELLQELWTALGEDVWTGYGTQTGVISYSRGGAEAFHASFMGGNYAFDLPFAAFTNAEKAANTDGSYTYTLTCNLPAQTGMGQETLHVTVKNGEITELESENAGIEMSKEEEITGWAALQAAFAQGGVIKLAANVEAPANAEALTVPADKTVMLELNGHIINRNLENAEANGSVIVNNGTLAIMDTEDGKILGGKTTGNGGGILNNGILTLYGGTIAGNDAAIGGGVYSTGNAQFWMTGGLIKDNAAGSYPAIGGDVIFNAQAMVQIDAQGTKVSVETALANMADYNYVQPVMPSYDELQPADPEALKLELLQELWTALGEDIWTGYGVNTGVISYSRGGQEAFHASFMGGNYAFDLPFAAFTNAEKAANTDGSYTYTLTCNLPAQTGMGQETLHVTVKNGEIEGLHSDNAGIDMTKEEEVTGWAALQTKLAAGGMVKLGADVEAPANAAALNIPQDVTVVLDLNGHSIDRALASAVADGSVIINNGTLAIMGEGAIKGGNTTGNGGGILNNGILTLYGGEIKNNHANVGGGGVYSATNAQFWMTAGLIKDNSANSNAAIGGNVIFNEQAMVQINANGDKVSVATALANIADYNYVQPVMPSYDDLQPADPEALKLELLQELWTALGEDVWTGYGTQTGVISYSRGGQEAFHASFMGGNYAFDLPFAAFTNAEKAANTDGSYTYTLTCNLPAQTGMGQETLHVTVKNGEIEGLHSDNAGIDMTKEEEVTGWAALQAKLNAGGMVKLGADVEAPANAAALNIPQDVTVVLDLNGHSIDRALASAVADGSVIINNGTLAIMGEGIIKGGNTTGNGGGILNNGILTLYGGEIKNNHANVGGGVYSTENAQFWMTAGLIMQNEASSYPAIGGEVIFNAQAMVQINAGGDKVSIADATAALATLAYVQPVMPSYEDLNPAVNDKEIIANVDPDNAGVYYSTFYDSAIQYELPAGVSAYVADLSGSDLVLTRIAGAGDVIPADNAVILKANSQNFTLTASVAIPVSFTVNNDLRGVDAATPLEDLGIDPLKCYVLSGTAQYGVGFYRINANTLKAHKAYVIYNGSNGPKRMRFIFGTATGVDQITNDQSPITNKVMIDGVIYIIKNGVRYNVQGQLVK